jgi:hypothetical protein
MFEYAMQYQKRCHGKGIHKAMQEPLDLEFEFEFVVDVVVVATTVVVTINFNFNFIPRRSHVAILYILYSIGKHTHSISIGCNRNRNVVVGSLFCLLSCMQ